MCQRVFHVFLHCTTAYFSQLWAEMSPTRLLALGGGWRSSCFPSCSQHPVTDVAGQEKSTHAESANFKSDVCKMKQFTVISKLLSKAQTSWSTLGDSQGCKKTPGKVPLLCILIQSIPPQIKLLLPSYLPVQNCNFYVPNLRAAPACPSSVFEVCWLLGLWC